MMGLIKSSKREHHHPVIGADAAVAGTAANDEPDASSRKEHQSPRIRR
jgi:hypothetical protein